MDCFSGWLSGSSVLLVLRGGALDDDYGTWLEEAGATVTTLPLEMARRLRENGVQSSFDIAVVDVDDEEGRDECFAAVADLAAWDPGCALAILATSPDADVVQRARALDGSLLAKPLTRPQFTFGVVSARDACVPCLRTLAIRAARRWLLSPQQARLLYFNLWSLSNQEIAEALGISVHTVQDYQRDLRRKTGARAKDGYLRRLLECSGVEPPTVSQ